ncbi:MAG: carbonic anhydrase [Vicinamibacterales bacterium]
MSVRSLRWWYGAAGIAVVLAAGLPVGAESPAAGESLARLRAGNARAVLAAGTAVHAQPIRPVQPVAVVLSCAESLLPAEHIFGAAPGELFVVRSLGHVVDHAALASVEYAVERLHVPLVVVLGHELCEAMKVPGDALPGQSPGPHGDFLLKALRPAVGRAGSAPEAQRLRTAVLEHVEESINTLLQQSTRLRHLAQDRRVRLVGGFHESATGRVFFSELVDVPRLDGAVAARH